MACCPAHEDNRQSLSIRDGADGRVLLKCHAGCDLSAILAALNLNVSDLFTSERVELPGADGRRREVAHYDYRDERGQLLYQVVRFEPKDFRQRRPDGEGWLWNLQGVRRVVYRLPDLAGHATVVIAEGEKDVDRLWSLGIAATTNVGGAGKWRDEYTKQLLEAGVERLVVIPDADDAGRQHAAAVALAWAPRPSRVISLPDVPAKGDVVDFLQKHSPEELKALLADPVERVPWLDVDAQWSAMVEEDAEAASGNRLWLALPEIDEVINGVRRGEVLGWMARPGIGKTTMLAHVTHACAEREDVGHVFFSLEMPAAQIVSRLQQRIFNIGRQGRDDAARAGGLDPKVYREAFASLLIVDTPGLSVSQMESILARAMEGPFKKLRLGLVTIDHLGLIGGDRKLSTYDRVSLQAREVKELAKRFGCAVNLAIQVSREAGGDGSKELGLGSARDSGVVEEAVDYLIGLRRLDRSTELAAVERERFHNVIFVKVIKNRHGDPSMRETAYRLSFVGLHVREERNLQPNAMSDIAQIANKRKRW